MKPLKTELAELEQLIMEQQDKICAIKSNILQNEEKIRKMVSSINVSQTWTKPENKALCTLYTQESAFTRSLVV